jgi:hypothetical protein
MAPSEGGDWQWGLLDADNRCEDFSKLVNIITDHFHELRPEPSTSGKGVHWVIRLGNYHPRWLYKLEDHAMHDLVISWCGRIKTATAKLASGSFVELKGACCAWKPAGESGAGGYLMGTLARMPVTLTAEQLNSLPAGTSFDGMLPERPEMYGLKWLAAQLQVPVATYHCEMWGGERSTSSIAASLARTSA